jgi:hypothetical protein
MLYVEHNYPGARTIREQRFDMAEASLIDRNQEKILRKKANICVVSECRSGTRESISELAEIQSCEWSISRKGVKATAHKNQDSIHRLSQHSQYMAATTDTTLEAK